MIDTKNKSIAFCRYYSTKLIHMIKGIDLTSNLFFDMLFKKIYRKRDVFFAKFGYFDDAVREYIITEPKTPYPWINYLGNGDFFH